MHLTSLQRRISRPRHREAGATLLEYVLIAALASVIVIIAVLAVLHSGT
jgi:Flp pilus assembly pilin Flp